VVAVRKIGRYSRSKRRSTARRPRKSASATTRGRCSNAASSIRHFRGRTTARRPGTGETRRWRFQAGTWTPAAPPREVATAAAVTATEAYDVGALVARMRAANLRDAAALRQLQANLEIGLHIQDLSGPGLDLGYRYRYFHKEGEPDEILQKEVLLNGVHANLKGEAQLPIIEAKISSALPVALALNERYEYLDAGPGRRPGTRLISFRAAQPDPTLYTGQLTVDEASGRILDERSHREGLPGVVKSEARTLTYGEPVPGFWTLVQLESFDRCFLLDETVLVQRRMTYDQFRINGADFATARQEARGSHAAMMVQTPEGMRYYTRRGDGERQVDPRSRTAGRAFGTGLMVDPSASSAVTPYAALLLYDFDAWGKGIQYSLETAVIVNAASISIPNLGAGFDGAADLGLSLLKDTLRPVRQGRLVDAEGVGRRRQTGGVTLGHDLGWGFRASLAGQLELNQYSLAPEDQYRSPDFLLPPSGLDRLVTGGLDWQGHGVTLQARYGQGQRPEGSYGRSGAIVDVPEGGRYRQWQGLAAYNLDLGRGRWLDLGLGRMAGSGFDRFKALEVDGLGAGAMAPGLRTGAIAADRVDYGRVSYVVPAGADLRLTFKLATTRMRSLDDQKSYSFTGLGIAGDLPGFWWFTTTRVDLGVGLQSQIAGVRTVNGTVSLLRVF